MVYMTTVPGADFRANMKSLLDHNEATHERIVITRNGHDPAVVLHPDDLESMEETIAILSDPELAATLRQSEAEIDAGKAIPFKEYLAAHRAAVEAQ